MSSIWTLHVIEYNRDITDRIIAMGFPSSGLESVYRNPLEEVKRFLDKRHKQFYKVYNLCIEKDRQYAANTFPKVVNYGFHDHHPPNLEMLESMCNDIVTIEVIVGRLLKGLQLERGSSALQSWKR